MCIINRILNRFSASEILSLLVFLPPGESWFTNRLRAAPEKIYRIGGELIGSFLL